MKKFLIIIIPLFMLNLSVFSQAIQEFDSANQSYEAGSYQSAVSKYQALVDSGYSSFELYYNLANAYYKIEEIPSSILYFEKALKLNPSDKDALFNLRLANLQTVDKVEAKEKLLLNKWWEQLVNLYPADGWATKTVYSLFLGFLLLGGYLVVKVTNLKKVFFFTGIAVIVIGISCWLMASAQNHRMTAENEAIVFRANVTVVSEPGGENELFVIHEGTKVEIVRQNDDWVEITLANGNSGWMKREDLQTI